MEGLSLSSKEDTANEHEQLDRRNQGGKLGQRNMELHENVPSLGTEATFAEASKTLSSGDTHARSEAETDRTETSTLTEHGAAGKRSSFAQLVRKWETYMTDRTGGQFQPMQVFQQLNLCGQEDGLARLTYGSNPQNYSELQEPSVFRHTHSTPSQHTPSILDDEDEDEPPPYGLEILNRSRSTPLSTSANSAFGTILKTAPYRHDARDRSAFTLPLHRLPRSEIGILGCRCVDAPK